MLMFQPFADATPVNGRTDPMPVIWSQRGRGATETALDSETAVSLACHLDDVFAASADWAQLLRRLSRRGFYLRFEGMRLALVSRVTGVSICTCAALGHSFANLAGRLGKPRVVSDSGILI